jgi:vesicle-associated membrane protein 7
MKRKKKYQMSGAGLVYCGVFEDGTVLTQCERGGGNGRVTDIAKVLLEKIDTSYDHRKSFSAHQGYTFQYLVEDEVAFLSAATDGFAQRICFAFLERVKNEFFENYVGTTRWRHFRTFLADEMEFFSTNPDADKIRGLRQKVNEVTDIMKGNIEKVLERGEKLEDLEARSEALQESAMVFHQSAKRLRCELCKKNAKLMIIIGITVVSIIIIIALILYFVLK